MKKEIAIEADDWDFGFTAMHETELESVQTVDSLQAKVDELYKAIIPLLENLKANPEKDFIKWPDRLKKVTAFEEKLRKIYEK